MHIGQDEVEIRFRSHAMGVDQQTRAAAIRAKAGELAALIVQTTPGSREQSEAITNLETASFFAVAAIARRE